MTKPAAMSDSSTAETPRWPDRVTTEAWAFLIGAFVFTVLALLVVFGWFDATVEQLVPEPMWIAMRQIVGGIVVIAALAWLLTLTRREAYLAAFWYTAPRLPGLIAVGWLLAYLAPPIPNAPPAEPLAVGLWVVLVVWMLLLLPLRRIAEIPTAQPETYRELVSRYSQLVARVREINPSSPGEDGPDLMTRTGNDPLDEARDQLEVVRKLLDLPDDGPPGARPRDDVAGGVEWVTSTGYISAWEALNRADEALIDASTVQAAIGEGLHDMLRLSGSHITNASYLQDALRAAVRKFDPEIDQLYFYPQRRRKDEAPPSPTGPDPARAADAVAPPARPSENDEIVMKSVIREVRHAVNVYRTSHAAALIRARARLLKAILVTGIAADVLLALAILMQVPRSALATAAVFFLVGGVVGLFNRLRLEGEGGPAMTSDYGLFDARLLGTLLISGLAGVGGVFLISAAPLVNVASGTDVEVMPLSEVFSLADNRIGLLVAALFGLTPELVVGSLRKQTDTLKKELSSTEAASSGSVASDAAAR